MELPAQRHHDQDDEGVGDKRGQHTRAVVWCVFGAEDGRADDAANGAAADEGCGGESALPLATDIVTLVCEQSWTICVA